jgi:serine/threonine protein kinase
MQEDDVKQSSTTATGSNNSPDAQATLGMTRELLPGTFFQNTYRIVHKLGQGSLGPVYLADHLILDQPCALRLLPRHLAGDEALIARFRRELNALREVRSSNVVSATELQFADDETPFLAMEYVDGPDLQSLLDIAPGPIDVDLTLAIVRCITEGLAAAHACGLVHRDLKPKNIFLAREANSWIPKVAGFALVAIKEQNAPARVTGETVLTQTYAAPEQWYGTNPADLDGRTDLYALGGILYLMLTGRTAFHAADYDGWAMQHIKSQPLPPSALRPDLTPRHGLDNLILRLLAKEPEARPRRAAEFLSILNAIEFGAPITPLAPIKIIPEGLESSSFPTGPIFETSTPSIEDDLDLPAAPPHNPDSANTTGSIQAEPVIVPPPPPMVAEAQSEEATAAVEPGTPIPQPPAVSPAAATAVANKEPDPQNHDLQTSLRNFVSGIPTPELEEAVEPVTGETSLDEPSGTAVEFEESAESKSAFLDRIDAFLEEPATSHDPVPEPTAEELPAEPTPEQKELVELQRIFNLAEASSLAPGKPGKTARLARVSAFSEAQILSSPPRDITTPVATEITSADMVQTPPDVAPQHLPDRPKEPTVAHESTAKTFTSSIGKIAAAVIILLAVAGFAEWRLISTNPSLPPKNLSQRCNAGDAKVCSQLAAWYEHTNTVKDGDLKAATYYARACDSAIPLACNKLGFKLLFGKGIPEDKPRAMTLLDKACTGGDHQSCDVLAEIYHNGQDVTQDDARSMQYYQKSCSLGEESGCKWAAQLDALIHPPPPVHHYRPAPAPETTPTENQTTVP